MQRADRHDGGRVAGGGRLLEPLPRLGVIGHAEMAAGEQRAEAERGLHVAGFRGLAIPDRRLRGVDGSAEPGGEQEAQRRRALEMAGLRRSPGEAPGGGGIGGDRPAIGKQLGERAAAAVEPDRRGRPGDQKGREPRLASGVALLGGQPMPAHGGRDVGDDAFAALVESGDQMGGFNLAGGGRGREFARRRGIAPGGEFGPPAAERAQRRLPRQQGPEGGGNTHGSLRPSLSVRKVPPATYSMSVRVPTAMSAVSGMPGTSRKSAGTSRRSVRRCRPWRDSRSCRPRPWA